MRWRITERVKRLAGNEIELGIDIPMTESWASNIPMDKGNYVCCHNGLTDKDIWRIWRNQYDHPGSSIVYWPEMSLGHVCIVLEPVGSACLTFGDDRYYEFMCFDVPKVVEGPRWDHRHDEESWNGQDIEIDILDDYVWTSEWFRVSSGITGVPGGYQNRREV